MQIFVIMRGTVSDDRRQLADLKPARAAFLRNIYPGIYVHTVIINGNRRRFLWEIPKTRSNLDAKRQDIIVARLPTARLAYATIGDATRCTYGFPLHLFPRREENSSKRDVFMDIQKLIYLLQLRYTINWRGLTMNNRWKPYKRMIRSNV